MYCTSDLYIYIIFAIAFDYGKLILLIIFHDHTHTNRETTITLPLESTTCLVVSYGIYRHGIVRLFFWFLSTHVFFIFNQGHLQKSTFKFHRFSSSTNIIQYLRRLNRRQRKRGLDIWNSDDTLGIPIVKDNVCRQYFVRLVNGYLSSLKFFSMMVKIVKFVYATLWHLEFTIPWVPSLFLNQERTCIECCATVNSHCFRWSTCMHIIQ